MEYNYKKFNSKEYDFSKSGGFHVGDTVPDFMLRSLSGDEVSLFDSVNRITVIEIGSITCPLYSGNIADMNKLAHEYPQIDFKVLYVREAHPGKKIPSHKEMKEKITLANTIKNYFPENRKILVDEISGTIHERFGLLPDTVLVIGEDRKVIYRIDWNSPTTLSKVLVNIRENKSIEDIIPKFSPAPANVLFPVLFRAGGDALFDFLIHLPMIILKKSKNFFFGKSKQF